MTSKLSIFDLQKLAEKYNLSIEGTGKNGRVLKNDYILAIEDYESKNSKKNKIKIPSPKKKESPKSRKERDKKSHKNSPKTTYDGYSPNKKTAEDLLRLKWKFWLSEQSNFQFDRLKPEYKPVYKKWISYESWRERELDGNGNEDFSAFVDNNSPLRNKKKSPLKAVSPPRKRKIPKKQTTYEIVNSLGFGLKKLGKTPKKEEYFGITVDEFRQFIDDNDFIKRMAASADNLMREKKKMYEAKIVILEKDRDKMMARAKKMLDKGVDAKTVNDLIPLEAQNIMIVNMKEIVDVIEDKIKNISFKQTKNNLIDALENEQFGLDSMIDREPIKNQLVTQLYAFSKNYKVFLRSFNNMAMLGPAGVGKTSLATVIGYMFSKSGILATDKVTIVSRSDLVAQYIGHTAIQTKKMLIGSIEGVLLIDEAYQLTPCPEDMGGYKDFGPEAITEMVNFLDKYIGMGIVIVAGYEGIMNRCFFPSNEGLNRRFPFRYVLSPYSPADLTTILIKFIESKSDAKIDKNISNFLFSLITQMQLDDPDIFKNQAGDMLNLGTAIVKAINSSHKISWGTDNDNIKLIKHGFNDFLRNKGYELG